MAGTCRTQGALAHQTRAGPEGSRGRTDQGRPRREAAQGSGHGGSWWCWRLLLDAVGTRERLGSGGRRAGSVTLALPMAQDT